MTDILKDVRETVLQHKAIADESRTAMQAAFRKLLESPPRCDQPAILTALMCEYMWRAGVLWASERAQRATGEVFDKAIGK